LVDEAEHRARGILTEHIQDLHKIAEGLLEYETLGAEEIKALLRGEAIHPATAEEEPEDRATPPSAVPTTSGKNKKRPGGLKPEPQPGS